MEFFNLFDQPINFFSSWHKRTVAQQKQDLHNAEYGTPYSNYMFPWVEGLVNGGSPIKGPPHPQHLASNFPKTEQTRNQNQAPPPNKPKKRKLRRGRRRPKTINSRLMRHRRR